MGHERRLHEPLAGHDHQSSVAVWWEYLALRIEAYWAKVGQDAIASPLLFRGLAPREETEATLRYA